MIIQIPKTPPKIGTFQNQKTRGGENGMVFPGGENGISRFSSIVIKQFKFNLFSNDILI